MNNIKKGYVLKNKNKYSKVKLKLRTNKLYFNYALILNKIKYHLRKEFFSKHKNFKLF